MKTETNLYLRSLIEKQRADLLNERSCIVNRITGSTMSESEIEDEAFSLSEIGQKIRKLDGFLHDLRQEGHKNELGPQFAPALSEKTVESIRRLLKIDLDCVNEMSAKAKCMAPLIPSGEAQDNFILAAKVKTDVATKALKEFNAAYPEKPKSK